MLECLKIGLSLIARSMKKATKQKTAEYNEEKE